MGPAGALAEAVLAVVDSAAVDPLTGGVGAGLVGGAGALVGGPLPRGCEVADLHLAPAAPAARQSRQQRAALPRRADPASTTIGAMQLPPRPPSIDQGVIALVWAVVLGTYIYFGLLAVGASAATAIVLALVSFAGIWLLVRLRGEETPLRRRPDRRS